MFATNLYRVITLYLAARDDSKKFINLLIDNRVETVVEDNLRRILLHYCTRLNYNVATKLLVDRGSLLSAMDNAGRIARENQAWLKSSPPMAKAGFSSSKKLLFCHHTFACVVSWIDLVMFMRFLVWRCQISGAS